MSVLNEDQLLGAPPASTSQYQIQRSLRFNSADSAYLSRTPSVAGNRKTWTWSGWVKRSDVSTNQRFFCGWSGSGASAGQDWGTHLSFQGGGYFYVETYIGANTMQLVTSQFFRDPGAWYHIVVALDTTQATASDRLKVYVNGAQVTAFQVSTYPTQNSDHYVNSTNIHTLGVGVGNDSATLTDYFSGYLADIHFIDGQALTPSSFGQTDATTGEWIPKAYTGTYGTNGFKLNFSNNSAATATTLGADSSGNGNNWTPNNLSVTAGAGNDSLVDTPTSYGTDTGVGGEVRGNYCTWNPLSIAGGALANGNLDLTNTGGGRKVGTVAVSSGKWYWEVLVTSTGDAAIGIMPPSNKPSTVSADYLGGQAGEYSYYGPNGNKIGFPSGGVSYGATFGSGDTIGVALDLDTGTLVFYKNGVSQGTAFTGLSGSFAPGASAGSAAGASMTANFGQRPFAYTAPAGFKALCDTNLPAPTIVKPSTVMDVKLYTGNASTNTISGLGFSPDFVWIKCRSAANWHNLFDTVRGNTKILYSNATDAELTETTASLTSFNSDGFSLSGSGSSGVGNTNANAATYAAWCWDAGSSTVTNTAGTIQSSVRANASAGFSIVTYTGTGANATVGHGLGVAPRFLVVKSRSDARDWLAYHDGYGATKYTILNGTLAAQLSTSAWNNTSPTSSVFSIGNAAEINTNAFNYVAYCFAPVAGYSAFGSYTGNGSTTDTAPFVYTGFRPRWILLKDATVSGDSWIVFDSARDAYNVSTLNLFPNLSSAENNSTNTRIDILSNGFKIRCANATGINANNSTMVFAAFAEFPFQYARAR